MKQLINNLVGNHLTASKAADICDKGGYTPTGIVLRNNDGSCCIVDMAAVRWLTTDEMWKIMHPGPISLVR